MRSHRPTLLVLAVLGAVTIAVLLAGGAGTGSGETTAAAAPHGSTRQSYLDRVRDAVVHGAATDFAIGTGVGGPSFEACVKGGLREALDGRTIDNLVAVFRRPYGGARAAQALNLVAATPASRCGHRFWVPELVEAARGLRSAGPIGAALQKLGVTYGPYLGRRCPRAEPRNCDTFGIDIAFRHAATRVEAVVGSQAFRLRTPGRHSGIAYRDWVGTLTHADLPLKRPRRIGNVAYTTIEFRVRFADGRRVRALFRHVPVLPGWC